MQDVKLQPDLLALTWGCTSYLDVILLFGCWSSSLYLSVSFNMLFCALLLFPASNGIFLLLHKEEHNFYLGVNFNGRKACIEGQIPHENHFANRICDVYYYVVALWTKQAPQCWVRMGICINLCPNVRINLTIYFTAQKEAPLTVKLALTSDQVLLITIILSAWMNHFAHLQRHPPPTPPPPNFSSSPLAETKVSPWQCTSRLCFVD